MPHVTSTFDADASTLERLLRPREDVLLERAVGDGCFELAEGPFRAYRRTVEVAPDGDGRAVATQRVDFELAIPVWGWLFRGVVGRELRQLPAQRAAPPWWSPPDRLSARQSTVLGLLAALSMVAGYLGTLLTQTVTYASREFDASDTAQGLTLAAVRVGVILALLIVALADRRGRRTMLLVAASLGSAVTALGALAPDLVVLGATQTVARGLSTALGVLIGITAVEEMPAGSRAYAVSVLAMSGALGAGGVVLALPLADLGDPAWRLLYLVPLLFLFGVRGIARGLPETARFLAHEHDDAPVHHEPEVVRTHRRRFALLAASGFLGAVFTAPASGFQNEFLRTERGFSAARISAFTILTNTPGGIGVVLGGRLADTRGRRLVGAVGLAGGVGATVLMYLTMGAPMWLFSVGGAIIGAAVVPALGVYGPEMFPTSLRGKGNGGITVLSVVGSSLGLLVAGYLSDQLGGFGPAMAVLAVGPAILIVLVLTLYPETAHLELEEINPEDAADPGRTGPPDGVGGGSGEPA